MEYQLSKKSRLPACIIDAMFMDTLWTSFTQEGEFIWNAVVGTGGDPLGKRPERNQQVIHEWKQLEEMLSSECFDYVQVVIEYPDKGAVSLTFKNYDPAGGFLIVTGQEQGWIDALFATINSLFVPIKDDFTTKLYSRYGSLLVHSVVPLAVSFLIVTVFAAVLIPGDIRRSELVWWISAGTVIATLKLGQILSDRLVKYILVRYPYLRWQQ